MLAGQVIAGHELLHLLSASEVSEVYLARALALGVQRVVKVFRTEDDAARERFRRDGQLLARLHHDAIARIHDVGELADGSPFLVIDHVDGPSLQQLASTTAVSLPNALVVLEQLVVALSHAHSLGVFHRHLDLSHVLLRAGDVRQVKVIGFSPPVGDEHEAATDIQAFAHLARALLGSHEIPEVLDSLLAACLAKDPPRRPQVEELVGHFARLDRVTPPTLATAVRSEVVAAPWALAAITRDVADQGAESPRSDAGRATLGDRIMTLIGEIAAQLAMHDPELVSLLRLEARIREQLVALEREYTTVRTHVERAGATAPPAVRDLHDALAERKRTLRAQQKPLQQRTIEVVNGHRHAAGAQVRALFDQLDRALDELRRSG
jgi:hypothetical protein